jgi:hypothetical protein
MIFITVTDPRGQKVRLNISAIVRYWYDRNEGCTYLELLGGATVAATETERHIDAAIDMARAHAARLTR